MITNFFYTRTFPEEKKSICTRCKTIDTKKWIRGLHHIDITLTNNLKLKNSALVMKKSKNNYLLPINSPLFLMTFSCH